MTFKSEGSEAGFIVESVGPPKLFGVFGDDGETGYLYIYEQPGQGVVRHLHIYDRGRHVQVKEEEVAVKWSSDLKKCGVYIWGKMRGIIDVVDNREGRVWLESRQTPGIGDKQWLEGF